MIKQKYIDMVKTRVSITTLVSDLYPTLSLQRGGLHRKKCCCPFHEEKTPSMFLEYREESELEILLDMASKLNILKEDIRIVEAKEDTSDANDPKVVERQAVDKFLVKNAMEKGQLIHLYYDKVDVDPVDLAIIEGRATTTDGLGYEVEMMV